MNSIVTQKIELPALQDSIRMIRERKGLTRKQLAKIANISESYLEKIEKRDCGISLEKFEIIMAALEMFPMLISYSDLNIKP